MNALHNMHLQACLRQYCSLSLVLLVLLVLLAAKVTRAVRLRDGKFLLLATALGRFKVSLLVFSCSDRYTQQWWLRRD